MRHKLALYVATVVFVIALTVAVFAVANATHGYSDAEIQASLVDTWEVEAICASLALAASSAVCVSSLVALAFPLGIFVRRLVAGAFVLGLAAVVIALSGHITFTNRVSALTGQTFGALYGLL